MDTVYRIISDEHKDILQYLKKKNVFFFKWSIWVNVWRPYYHKKYGRNFVIFEEYLTINSLNTDLNSFILKWPCIDDYFIYAKKKQIKCIKKANKLKTEML